MSGNSELTGMVTIGQGRSMNYSRLGGSTRRPPETLVAADCLLREQRRVDR